MTWCVSSVRMRLLLCVSSLLMQTHVATVCANTHQHTRKNCVSSVSMSTHVCVCVCVCVCVRARVRVRARVCVCVCGYFKIERGVRQGDPLSPYLFLTIVEILAHTLRRDTGLKGINLENFEVRQILYADDMTIFIRDKAPIKRLEQLFQSFREVSGLKVYLDKTNIMLIGKNLEDIGQFQFGSVVTEIKILGIVFSLHNKTRKNSISKKFWVRLKDCWDGGSKVTLLWWVTFTCL